MTTKDTRRNRVRGLTPKQREAQQRKADAALTALCSLPNLAGPIVYRAGTSTGRYAGNELTAPAIRPGADKQKQYPSRMGSRLHYQGGLVTDLAGRAIETFEAVEV